MDHTHNLDIQKALDASVNLGSEGLTVLPGDFTDVATFPGRFSFAPSAGDA